MIPPEDPSSARTTGTRYFVYILRCSDASYYVGHTADVPQRVELHNSGRAASWTAQRRPVKLVHSERAPSRADAMRREQQLKGWSRAKKEALIAGHLVQLKALSRCHSQHC